VVMIASKRKCTSRLQCYLQTNRNSLRKADTPRQIVPVSYYPSNKAARKLGRHRRCGDIVSNNSNIGGVLATDSEVTSASLNEVKDCLDKFKTGHRLRFRWARQAVVYLPEVRWARVAYLLHWPSLPALLQIVLLRLQLKETARAQAAAPPSSFSLGAGA